MKFDYIIIGAGSAGCVLSNRLSENQNNNVAVFEAGGSSDIWKVKMPLALLYTSMIQNIIGRLFRIRT